MTYSKISQIILFHVNKQSMHTIRQPQIQVIMINLFLALKPPCCSTEWISREASEDALEFDSISLKIWVKSLMMVRTLCVTAIWAGIEACTAGIDVKNNAFKKHEDATRAGSSPVFVQKQKHPPPNTDRHKKVSHTVTSKHAHTQHATYYTEANREKYTQTHLHPAQSCSCPPRRGTLNTLFN